MPLFWLISMPQCNFNTYIMWTSANGFRVYENHTRVKQWDKRLNKINRPLCLILSEIMKVDVCNVIYSNIVLVVSSHVFLSEPLINNYMYFVASLGKLYEILYTPSFELVFDTNHSMNHTYHTCINIIWTIRTIRAST